MAAEMEKMAKNGQNPILGSMFPFRRRLPIFDWTGVELNPTASLVKSRLVRIKFYSSPSAALVEAGSFRVAIRAAMYRSAQGLGPECFFSVFGHLVASAPKSAL